MTKHTTLNRPEVTLRPFQAVDLDFFATLARDERVTRFVGDGQPWSADQISERAMVALRHGATGELGAVRWFIAEEDGRPVGLFVSTRRQAAVEIGYWVAPEQWGRGLAGALIDRGLDVLPSLYGTAEFSARVSPDNTASARALTRRHFLLQGHIDGLDVYLRSALQAPSTSIERSTGTQ
jgi:RimJ/RimL family protein N-acetyltransferase